MDTGLTPWMAQKVAALLRYGQSIGIDAEVRSARRSCAEQNAIYDGGAGTATTVSGCHSWHVWGRAVDLRIPGDRLADYLALGEEWERWGGVWGGRWATPQDPGHFEWHPDVPDIHDVCPRGAGDEACPNPNASWPDDRPLFARPGVQLFVGAGLVASGIYLARRLVSVRSS